MECESDICQYVSQRKILIYKIYVLGQILTWHVCYASDATALMGGFAVLIGGIAQPPMILSHPQYVGLKGSFMEEEFSIAQYAEMRHAGKKIATASTDKSLRTVLLAVLFQVSWPKRLTRREIIEQLPLYGENPKRALYRDIETLTDWQVEELPEPDAENLV